MLTQKIVLGYSTKVFVQIFQFATSLVVARILGPGILGVLAYSMAFVSMFNFISDLGFSSAHIKLVSEGYPLDSCNGTFAKIKIILNLVFAFTVLAVFSVQTFILNYKYEDPDTFIIILIFLSSTFITNLYNIPSTTFAAFTLQAKQDIPSFVQNLFYQIFRVIVVLIGFKALAISIGNLLSAVIIFPIYFYFSKDFKFGKYDKEIAKQYFKIARPVIIIIIAQTIIFVSDKVILQYFSSNEDVGYYASSFNLLSFFRLIEGSIGIILFPTFSSLIASKNLEAINSIIYKLERFTSIFILPFALMFSVFSDLIIKFTLGAKFTNSIDIFSVLAITFFVSLFTLQYGQLLLGFGYFKIIAKIWIASSLFFIIICLILIHPNILNLKGLGTAFSLLFANLLIMVLFINSLKKKNPNIRLLTNKIIYIFGFSFYFLSMVIYRFIDFSFMEKIFLMAGFLVIYWGIIFGTRLAGKTDVEVLWGVINVKNLKNYINKEISKK